MKTNPGGQLSPENIIGRQREIDQIWENLESQSIYISAERRIGKSSILRKLEHEPRPGWTPIYRDLEGLHSAEELAFALHKDVDQFLSAGRRAKRRMTELAKLAAGSEIGGVFKLPDGKPVEWKTVLEKSVEDLADAFAKDGSRLLLLWDEVPFVLDNIAKRQGDKVAMQVLDHLRYLRQTYPCLRMVLTGSVGLHHVLAQLKRVGYANSPINDMVSFEVAPLLADDGTALARKLLIGESVKSSNVDAAASAIANSVDHFAFYVHHLVRRLKNLAIAAEPAAIADTLAKILRDPADPWELRYYLTRITTYYDKDESLALVVLDTIASASSIPFDDLFVAVKKQIAITDKEMLRAVLVLLQRDHYVRRDDNRRFEFSYGLIRSFWRVERDLS